MTHTTIFEGIDPNYIEIENEGFFPDYEVEVYWDVRIWNGARTAHTNEVGWEGNTVSPGPYTTQDGDIDIKEFAKEIRNVINHGIDDEDRVGPVYIVC